MTSEEATDAILEALSAEDAGEIEVVIVHEHGCACEDDDDTCDCEPEHRVIEH